MKHIILLVIISLSFSTCSAYSQEDSVRSYYNSILSAEDFCMREKYVEAANSYRIAFTYKGPFATDIFNYMLCALNLVENATVLKCAELLVKKGASRRFFEQSIFSVFKKSNEYNILQQRYDEWHRGYQTTTNQALIEYIRKLVVLDQNVHCALPVKYKDTAFVNSMHSRDDSLAIILRELLHDNNHLDESIIGAAFTNDTVLRQEPLYAVIALHQVQRGGKELTNAIKEAVIAGNLRSEVALGWLSQNTNAEVNLTREYTIYKDTLWRMKRLPSDSPFPEKMRKQLDGTNAQLLYKMYLDPSKFNVEQRVTYNFFNKCINCERGIPGRFLFLPRAYGGTIEEGQEGQYEMYLHLLFEPIEYKK